MSRIFNRPMFKRGGSAGQGITSGLDRPGYAVGDRVTSEEILKSYGPAPRAGYNVFDFLTNWGLNMAGNPPSGNIFQTAAKEAQEPYAEFAKGKGEGALRDYAARVQATDKARDINLKLDLADITNTGFKKYGVQEPRSTFTLAATKNNLNIMGSSPTDMLKKLYPSGMALWETANVYDGRFHDNLELAPIGEKEIGGKTEKAIDLEEIGKIENANKKIFLDVISEEWFTVKFENGVWKVNQTAKPNISNDPAEDFTDKALQKLQNTIISTEDATIINNEIEVDEKVDKKVVDWETEVEQEKFKDVTKYTEEYLRKRFETYIQGLRNKQSIASQAGMGSQAMASLSAEDTVFWRNYQKDPEKAYQRWKNKITSFGKKQTKQKKLSEKIGVNIDYGTP